MAFACGKLRRAMPGATIVVALDRLDLDEQVTAEFASAGVQKLDTAATRAELQQKIKEGQRGVIITTIYRFREAGLLTEREDVVVMIDEAHRTQEGLLGLDMRKALPNATYIGMTGTPISTAERDTFENFGDPDDPDWVLNKYGPERSIADGATLPFIVEAPRLDLQIDQEALDQAFDELTAEEGLTENEKELIARKVGLDMTKVRVCVTCGAPFTRRNTRQRHCPTHEPRGREHASPTTRAQLDGTGLYDKNRHIVLAGNPSCAICGLPGADSVDHVLPVALGGTNALSNLRPAHLSCNCSRGAKLANTPRYGRAYDRRAPTADPA